MKLKLISTLLVVAAVTGCAGPQGKLITPTANGYDKIVFQKTARFKVAPAIQYTIIAGSEFIQDRTMKDVPVYCGQVTRGSVLLATDAGTQIVGDCFIYEDHDAITVNPMRLYHGTRKLPQGTIKLVKAKR
ncbi:hypothetical protein SAMN05444141_1067 [Pseudovibrio denitrificans]|uniref:Lipoprotein n=1 Tax=Pseudovibrio denitrificans TaxID=258256 RepID=A0A1I7CIM2_9HYPH|nr:hypothetical protein [Pseudovibrio denitrificans]SFT99288.1 hypothetical protein SAMN05444141_1067 [Pseudovibrio denitrificans]